MVSEDLEAFPSQDWTGLRLTGGSAVESVDWAGPGGGWKLEDCDFTLHALTIGFCCYLRAITTELLH